MLIRCPTCRSSSDVACDRSGAARSWRCAACVDDAAAVIGRDAPEIMAEARVARRPSGLLPAKDPAMRRTGAGALRRMASGLAGTALVLAGVAAGMAAIAFKDDVVRALPRSAAVFAALGLPVNLRGLALTGVRSTLVSDPGGKAEMLTLEGRISNLRRAANPIPQLRIVVRDKRHNDLYSWLAPPPQPELGPGEAVIFRSRLSAPPEDGEDVVVSFATGALPTE